MLRSLPVANALLMAAVLGQRLSHHSKKFSIFSAGAVQARHPIHGRSVQGWRRAAELL